VRIDRAEQTGLGVALGGHLLLFGLLWAGFVSSSLPPLIERQPVEVQLVDEVGLESGAPQISQETPAPKLGEVDEPIETSAPPIPEPVARPEPQPKAAPAPQPAPKAKQKAAPQPKASPPAKAARPKAAARPSGRLDGLLKGVSDAPSRSQSTAPRAANVTAAVQSSLAAEIRRQLKPHWRAPSGADSELLVTILEVRLAKDGSIIGAPQVVDQIGENASNRTQAGLHRENAIKAVRLAAPFNLPADYYDAWRVIRPRFDRRLSQ
jgi:outer membrane biosynthesis protein TonB